MTTAICTKIRYHDRIGALIALANTGRKRHTRRAKSESRVYRCPKCHGWHLTSQGGR